MELDDEFELDITEESEFSPIQIAELRQHIDWLSQEVENQIDGFTDEFNRIERKSEAYELSCARLAAEHDQNKRKNRYANVMPWDHSRVKLNKSRTEDGSDYINANYIYTTNPSDGGREKRYIACQGPLASTCSDFWHMIWAEHISVVVMLTKLKENERCKCFQYWPDEEPEAFGSLTVVPMDTQPLSDSIVQRNFILIHGDEHRELAHFQYEEWPDHGTPHNTSRFRELLCYVDQALPSPKDLILVHCSAGIGRTGTFCVVHSILSRLYDGKDGGQTLVNVPDTVLKLRYSRAGMVQTKDQYVFCYLAIQEGYEEWVANQKHKHQHQHHRATASEDQHSVSEDETDTTDLGDVASHRESSEVRSFSVDLTPAYPELSPPTPMSLTGDDISIEDAGATLPPAAVAEV